MNFSHFLKWLKNNYEANYKFLLHKIYKADAKKRLTSELYMPTLYKNVLFSVLERRYNALGNM